MGKERSLVIRNRKNTKVNHGSIYTALSGTRSKNLTWTEKNERSKDWEEENFYPAVSLSVCRCNPLRNTNKGNNDTLWDQKWPTGKSYGLKKVEKYGGGHRVIRYSTKHHWKHFIEFACIHLTSCGCKCRMRIFERREDGYCMIVGGRHENSHCCFDCVKRDDNGKLIKTVKTPQRRVQRVSKSRSVRIVTPICRLRSQPLPPPKRSTKGNPSVFSRNSNERNFCNHQHHVQKTAIIATSSSTTTSISSSKFVRFVGTKFEKVKPPPVSNVQLLSPPIPQQQTHNFVFNNPNEYVNMNNPPPQQSFSIEEDKFNNSIDENNESIFDISELPDVDDIDENELSFNFLEEGYDDEEEDSERRGRGMSNSSGGLYGGNSNFGEEFDLMSSPLLLGDDEKNEFNNNFGFLETTVDENQKKNISFSSQKEEEEERGILRCSEMDGFHEDGLELRMNNCSDDVDLFFRMYHPERKIGCLE